MTVGCRVRAGSARCSDGSTTSWVETLATDRPARTPYGEIDQVFKCSSTEPSTPSKMLGRSTTPRRSFSETRLSAREASAAYSSLHSKKQKRSRARHSGHKEDTGPQQHMETQSQIGSEVGNAEAYVSEAGPQTAKFEPAAGEPEPEPEPDPVAEVLGHPRGSRYGELLDSAKQTAACTPIIAGLSGWDTSQEDIQIPPSGGLGARQLSESRPPVADWTDPADIAPRPTTAPHAPAQPRAQYKTSVRPSTVRSKRGSSTTHHDTTPRALDSRQHQRQHRRLTVVKTLTARGQMLSREEISAARTESHLQPYRPRDGSQEEGPPRNLRGLAERLPRPRTDSPLRFRTVVNVEQQKQDEQGTSVPRTGPQQTGVDATYNETGEAAGTSTTKNSELATHGSNQHTTMNGWCSHTPSAITVLGLSRVASIAPAKTPTSTSIRFLEQKQQQRLQQQREYAKQFDGPRGGPLKHGGGRRGFSPLVLGSSNNQQPSKSRPFLHAPLRTALNHSPKPQVGACAGFGAAWTVVA